MWVQTIMSKSIFSSSTCFHEVSSWGSIETVTQPILALVNIYHELNTMKNDFIIDSMILSVCTLVVFFNSYRRSG